MDPDKVELPLFPSHEQQSNPPASLLTSIDHTSVAIEDKPVPVPSGKRKYNFPIFIFTISLIQIGIFNSFNVIKVRVLLGYDPYRPHDIWRYLSSILAHVDEHHLWGNVIIQLIFGLPLEMMHSWRKVAEIYFISGLGGTLVTSLTNPGVYYCGASPAVVGSIFAHFSDIVMNWTEMRRKCCRILWLLLFISFVLGMLLYDEVVQGFETRTSHVSHVVGAMSGFLVAIIILKKFEEPAWEKKLQQICTFLLVVGLFIILCIKLASLNYYLPVERDFDFGKSYKRLIFHAIRKSPENRELCESNETCKIFLDQFIHNQTFPLGTN